MIINNITEWVTKLMQPILDNPEKLYAVITATKKDWSALRDFRRSMHDQEDLIHACNLPDTDVDILVAIVVRYVHMFVLREPLLGEYKSELRLLDEVERAMNTDGPHKRGKIFQTV